MFLFLYFFSLLHCPGSKETPVCEAEHIGSTTAETQTKNEIDLQEAHNQTYDLQNSIVISLKDVFRGDIKEETESADETMARATGEQLSTSEIPNFNLQDSQPTINKSAVDDHRYTKGELAHSTKTIVNREVEEKGPEDCATETNCKPTSAVRGKRGRPPKKKRKQRKQAKSVSSKVLPVQPDLDDPLVKEKATKGFPIIYTEDSVTSQSSEMLQTELQPIQESSNTLVKSKKNTEVCYLPVSVECNGKGPKKQKPTESKKALSPKKSDGEQVNPKSKKSESPTCDKRFNMDESFSTSDGRNQGSHSDKQTTEKCSSSERTIKKYKTKSKVLNDKQAKVTNSISPKRLVKKDQQGSTVVKKCIGKVWYPPTLPPNEMPSRETTKPPAKVKDKTPFEPFNKCGVCGRVFSSSAALETHVSLHELNKPFSCSLCGKSFLDSAGLKRHGRVHRNGRIHVCHLCGKGFVYKFGLSKHLEMVHDKIKRFICQTCNKTFFTKRDVEIHIRSHTGETPFHCNLCERQFTSQVKLNVHLRWHNGEKRHWCPYCDKGFLDYNNLKRHKYIHTGERPCSCPYCPKNFTQIDHLQCHPCVQ
uniref:C2H2-type domain-containing protein n=1 Tax=Oryzias latipes TaxID=8090 RepID=H2MGN2_ORYLA